MLRIKAWRSDREIKWDSLLVSCTQIGLFCTSVHGHRRVLSECVEYFLKKKKTRRRKASTWDALVVIYSHCGFTWKRINFMLTLPSLMWSATGIPLNCFAVVLTLSLRRLGFFFFSVADNSFYKHRWDKYYNWWCCFCHWFSQVSY